MNIAQQFLLDKKLNDKVLNNTMTHVYVSDAMTLFSADLLLKIEKLETEKAELIESCYDIINRKITFEELYELLQKHEVKQ